MPQPRQHPITYLAKNGSFPDGPFRPKTPPEVYLAAAVARRLKGGIRYNSIRSVAKKADLSPQTIINILNGKSWPDLRTIAKLENACNSWLWGTEHRRDSWTHRNNRTDRS